MQWGSFVMADEVERDTGKGKPKEGTIFHPTLQFPAKFFIILPVPAGSVPYKWEHVYQKIGIAI